MSSKDRLPEELIALERALAALEPAPSRIDRDRLMFAAGSAASAAHSTQAIDTHATESGRNELTRPAAGPDTQLPANRQNRPQIRSPYRILAWPLTTAASILIACLFATLYAIESSRGPVTIREVVYVNRPTTTPGPVLAAENPVREPNSVTGDIDRPVRYTVWQQPILPFGSLKAQLPSYIALRQLAIEQGIDALPQPEYTDSVIPRSHPRTASELLKEYLPARAGIPQANEETFAPESIHLNLGDMI